MTKKEIFDKIVETSAEVCGVATEDIMNQCRKFDAVTARSIATFWCIAAGFSVESLMKCADLQNHNSIDSIKLKIEEYWVERFAYHMLVREVGTRLLKVAHLIGEDFDAWKPINHIQINTGKVYYQKSPF